MARTAKLFWNGRSQAVRLPAEFRFEGTEVEIRKDDKTGEVVLTPLTAGNDWADFVRIRAELIAAGGMAEDFLRDRNQGSSQRDDFLDDA